MADVTRQRAQIMLVTALALAVTFVALAMLLNTAIYSENLATRDTAGDERTVGTFQLTVREGVGGAVEYANDNEDGAADQNDELSASVRNLSTGLAHHHATRGRLANLSLHDHHDGTRIEQTAARNYTNATGAANWTLVEEVEDARAVRLHVNASTLASNDTAPANLENDDVFRVTATTDAGATHRAFVYENGTDLFVTVDRAGDVSTCTGVPATGNVTVDLSAGTVGEQSCRRLGFVPDLTDDFSVRYEWGSEANGTYGLVVNQTSLDTPDDTDHYDGQPDTRDAIYDAVADVTFESRDVYYRTRFRIAPGEDDA